MLLKARAEMQGQWLVKSGGQGELEKVWKSERPGPQGERVSLRSFHFVPLFMALT